jgi:hypothetical protein
LALRGTCSLAFYKAVTFSIFILLETFILFSLHMPHSQYLSKSVLNAQTHKDLLHTTKSYLFEHRELSWHITVYAFVIREILFQLDHQPLPGQSAYAPDNMQSNLEHLAVPKTQQMTPGTGQTLARVGRRLQSQSGQACLPGTHPSTAAHWPTQALSVASFCHKYDGTTTSAAPLRLSANGA